MLCLGPSAVMNIELAPGTKTCSSHHSKVMYSGYPDLEISMSLYSYSLMPYKTAQMALCWGPAYSGHTTKTASHKGVHMWTRTIESLLCQTYVFCQCLPRFKQV